MKHVAFIGIGSNLGDKEENCRNAVSNIRSSKCGSVLKISNWYATKALKLTGKGSQPDFINGAIKIKTTLDAMELLQELKTIEVKMGRKVKRQKWAPRPIDLDILFFDGEIIDLPCLKVPHPEISKRIFVLKPLCDIEPGLVHPELNISVRELLKNCRI